MKPHGDVDDGQEKHPSAPVCYPEQGAGTPLLGGAGAGAAAAAGGRTTTSHTTSTSTNSAPPLAPLPPNWDPEAAAAAEYAVQFADAEVRKGFATRVLSIVSFQLLLTAAMTAAFFSSRRARLFLSDNASWTVPLSWATGFAVSTVLACSERARRSHPGNLVALGAFTLSFGYVVAATSALYSASSVLVASVVTAAVSLGALVIAARSATDFTRLGGVLLLSSWSFLVAILVGTFFVRSSAAVIALSAVGAVLFSLYLLFDLQMIMSGLSTRGGQRRRRACELDPDDYVFGALTIYLDIINVFVNVLQIVQAASDSS